MAQHDYVIANASGANVRADINNMALAISSNNSGSSAPSTTYAYLWWLDTGNNLLKLRNSANNAWITMPFSVTADNTVDINGGAIDGTPIGASSASTGAFSTLSASSGLTVVGTSQITNTSSIDTLTLVGNTGSVAGVKLQAEEVHGAMYGINIGSNYGGLAFHTNQNGTVAERLRIDDSGRFGLGTTSPSNKLHVHETNTNTIVARIESSVANSYLSFEDSSTTSGQVRVGATGNDLVMNAGGSQRLVIKSTGAVGIATTSPQYTLHVLDTIGTRTLSLGNGVSTGTITTDSAKSLNFQQGGSTKMTLDSTGKLGVGTTSPGAKLDVNGQVFISPNTAGKNTFQLTTNASNDGRLKMLSDTTTKVDIQVNGNTYFNGGNVAIGTASPENLLHVYKGDSGSTYTADGADQIILENSDSAIIDIRTPAANSGGILFSDNNARGRGQLVYYHSDDAMAFLTAGSERARIMSDGTTLIGKTDTALSSVGNQLSATGGLNVTRNDGNLVNLNRKSTHGSIMEFYKDGSSVGSISTNSNSLPSDRNFKKDIADLNIGLDLVKKLEPKQYRYKHDEDNIPVMYGIIAQDLETSLTEVGVTKNSTWLLQHEPTEDEKKSDYSLDYTKLTPILVKAIQEQQEQIEQLKTEIQTLKGE